MRGRNKVWRAANPLNPLASSQAKKELQQVLKLSDLLTHQFIPSSRDASLLMSLLTVY